MMDSPNPYQAPVADLAVSENPPTHAFTPGMVQALKETKPWVRFLSILGFVGCGLMFLACLFIAVVGAVADNAFGGGVGALLGVVYFIMGALWILPLVHLHKYANAITPVTQGAGANAIEAALASQRSFWRTIGIMTLVVLGLYFVSIFVVAIAGMIGSLSNL